MMVRPINAEARETTTRAYGEVLTGKLNGAVSSAAQCPDIPAALVRLKAMPSNAGNVYLGPSGVTKPGTSTDSTMGLVLAPGDDTGWLPIDNLNRLYHICDNAGDNLTYMVLR